MNNDTFVVELDRIRTLKFRRKELKMLEKMFNVKSISDLTFDNISTDDMTKIIHLGLTHEDPELTLEQAEALIDEYPFFGVLFKLAMNAFSVALAGPDAMEIIKNKQTETAANEPEKN